MEEWKERSNGRMERKKQCNNFNKKKNGAMEEIEKYNAKINEGCSGRRESLIVHVIQWNRRKNV